MAREKCDLLAGPRTVPLSWVSYQRPSYVCGVICRHARPKLHMYFVIPECAVSHIVSARHSCAMYSAWNLKDNYDMSASVFVVQFNGFLSLTT